MCRGWGGAAGEEGDAESNDDDDEEDEDEDQDDEDQDDADDSSSDGSCFHVDVELGQLDWSLAGPWDDHNASDSFLGPKPPSHECSFMPVHQMAGYNVHQACHMPGYHVWEGCQEHAGKLKQTHLGSASTAALWHAMQFSCLRPPHRTPSFARYAAPFRTQQMLSGGYGMHSLTKYQVRCKHSKKVLQHSECTQQQTSKKCQWSRAPHFVLHTLINILGSSM